MTVPPLALAPAGEWSERRDRLRARLGRFPEAVLVLLFRVGVAGVFWHSGQAKLASWQATVALFAQEYRVPVLPPELAATLATAVEVSCPVLLVLGLAARLATLPMLGMIAVIQIFVYPEAWNEHLIWAALLLFILTRGPGALSLDHVILRRLSRE